MAKHGEAPTQDLAAGRAVLAQQLPLVLEALGYKSLEEAGWKQPDASTLLIPLTARLDGERHDYTLKLKFLTCNDWPPSAQFVNPDTNGYSFPADTEHLPRIEGYDPVNVHTNYCGSLKQLICCSATYEYYAVLHSGDDKTAWRSNDTFLVTLNAIRKALGSRYYKGRQPNHAG